MNIPESRDLSYRLSCLHPPPLELYFFIFLCRITGSFHSPLLHKVRLAPTGTIPERLRLKRKKKKPFLSLVSSPVSHYFSPSSGKQTALQTKQQHTLDLTQLHF